MIAASHENIIDGLRRVTKKPVRKAFDFWEAGRSLRWTISLDFLGFEKIKWDPKIRNTAVLRSFAAVLRVSERTSLIRKRERPE